MSLVALLLGLQVAAAAETSINLNPMGVLGFALLNVADYLHGGEPHTSTLGGNIGYRFHREGGTFFGLMEGIDDATPLLEDRSPVKVDGELSLGVRF